MIIATNPRPNRLTEEKDEDYHLRYARWALANYNVYYYQDFVARYMTNIAFYKGNQWIFNEDLEAFLMDESGEPRNRIKWVQNIIKPFVEYYRGAVTRMDLNSEVISVSRESKNRRDRALDKMMFWSQMAQMMMDTQNPQAAQMIQQRFGVKMSEAETEQRFNNLYIDEYAKTMNGLLKYISGVRNDVHGLRKKLGEDIALSGLGILKEFDFAGEQIWTRTSPERFIFDNTCEDDTLADSEYMGEFRMASATDLYEMYPNLDKSEKELIETSMTIGSLGLGLHNLMSFYLNYAEKVPVYELYWRDVATNKYGAFLDEFGYPVLEEVSEKNPLNELIPVDMLVEMADDYDWIRMILNKGDKKITKNVAIIETEQVRFCNFIPQEYSNAGHDICLDYGVRKYSQKNRIGYRKPDFPYKCATYSYILGEIMSPVDALISPQRFVNRVLSAAESHINNSRGSGTVIDLDSVDDQGGEEEVQRNMNVSKPVYVRAQRQVNNVIGSYDATIKQGTLSLFDIANRMKQVANDIFGGGQQVIGEGGAYRATGSVAQMNLNQGIIMQEPYFNAMEKIYMQSYNSMLDRGKRIYLANKRELAFAVGDDGVNILQLSDDYLLEDFMCKIIRNADFYSERDAADQLLMVFLQSGLIDQKTFAAAYHNSTVSDVAYHLRSYTGLKVEAEKTQAEAMQQAAQIEAQQVRAAGDVEDARENKRLALDAEKAQGNNEAKVLSAAITASSREKSQEAAKKK